MIVKESLINKIDEIMESKGMKKGFWAGLVAFVLAKITHILVTFAIGFWVGIMFGNTATTYNICNTIDNPIVGLIYLIFVTRFIYLKITK